MVLEIFSRISTAHVVLRFDSNHGMDPDRRDNLIIDLQSRELGQSGVIFNVSASVCQMIFKFYVIVITTPDFVEVDSFELSFTSQLIKLEVDLLSFEIHTSTTVFFLNLHSLWFRSLWPWRTGRFPFRCGRWRWLSHWRRSLWWSGRRRRRWCSHFRLFHWTSEALHRWQGTGLLVGSFLFEHDGKHFELF